MRKGWRPVLACVRLAPAIAVLMLLLLAATLLLPTRSLAQSSVGQAANAATGRSLADSVDKNLNDLIYGQVLGGALGGGTGGSAGAAGINVIPTGRVRGSAHDGLGDGDNSALSLNFGWQTLESSAFVNVVYGLPGTVMGGQVKLAGFAGGNWISLDMTNGRGNVISTANDQRGSASNDSAILGGTALWASKNTYAVATIVGFLGQTRLNDAMDFCGPPCVMRRYHFDTGGFMSSLTTGYVFQLTGSPTGPLLDLRGALSYTQNIGDSFLNQAIPVDNPDPDQQKYKFSTWAVTGSATLFTNIATQNSGLLRPYLQTYVRQEIDYRNKLRFILDVNTAGATPGLVSYEQAHTYGGVDTGLTYTQGNMTLGAAAYIDWSGDEFTVGGRLGASWKLQ
jgi:hypothetical protein